MQIQVLAIAVQTYFICTTVYMCTLHFPASQATTPDRIMVNCQHSHAVCLWSISFIFAYGLFPSSLYRFSIHARQQSDEVRAVIDGMPIPVEGCPNVYHCGFSSKDSFGSTSYLIVRETGNVLVDSPRFDKHLLKQIQVSQLRHDTPLVAALINI
jgi:hypothetical protein